MPLTRGSVPLAALLLGACFVDVPIDSDDTATASTSAPETSTGLATTTTTTGGAPVCGDGEVNGDEACDPAADPAGTCTPACTQNLCGDGFVVGDEACDDGNTRGNDGCSPTCRDEVCGDTITHPWESCDDGNTADGDGCSALCQLEGCGDGVIQPGEQCDDANNVDDDACTSLCKVPACGDGLLAPSMGEECDLGPQNNDQGECTSMCKLAACGDGLLGPNEACDDGNQVSLDGCGLTCARDARFVFLTSQTFSGNLGGILGADTTCQELANSAGLPGTYIAWLSTEDIGAVERLAPADLPYILPVVSTVIANTTTDLLDGLLAAPIDHDEYGQLIPGEPGDACVTSNLAWTNSNPNGTPKSTSDCSDWLSEAPGGLGRTGHIHATDSRWTNSNCGSWPCSASLRLYCVET